MHPPPPINVLATALDHKPDFENHPKCRLINPSKSSLGKVSKVILDRINNDIRDQVHVNQWRSDIVDFYPSISEPLLDQAIEWAKQHSDTKEIYTESSLRGTKCAKMSADFRFGRHVENSQNIRN